MDELDQLYQDILIDHYKRPRNHAALDPSEVLADEDNPLCGDQIRLTARIEAGQIVEVRFDGKGCVISQASASMMTEALKGLPCEDARAIIARFVEVMRGERDFDDAMPRDLLALGGVRKFPLRVKCATLCWYGMEKALDRLEGRN